jgi:hypothetical protein
LSREYQEAEAVDAAVERSRQEEEQARVSAAAAAAAAAHREVLAQTEAENEAELQRALQMSLRSDVEEAVAASRARLGASPESAAGTSAVRIRLPSGKMLQRKFPPLAPLSLVVDYVVVASRELSGEEALDPLAFDLVVNQPKRTFNLHTQGSTDFELSLQSAGVVGAVVLVHKCSR